jgi:hypothetical protein
MIWWIVSTIKDKDRVLEIPKRRNKRENRKEWDVSKDLEAYVHELFGVNTMAEIIHEDYT